jgi:minor extracellular serine protease Vpr
VVFAAQGGAQDLQELVPESPGPVAADTADETPQAWFVELSGAPTADGGSLASVRNEKNAFRNAARKAGVVYTERFAYDNLFNGFAIATDVSQLPALRRLAGVKALYPIDTVSLPEPAPGDSLDLATAIAMTGADIAQNSLGLDGTGVKVAVMDTGIDIDHPAFGGSGTNGTTAFPTARIVAGWDFVGDAFNADPASPVFNPNPVPDAVPDDCGGHGSHVAGIVGANGLVKGVAPNVSFGAYRVFGCAGSTTSDIMLAAMERARADGMHVLNMSIGSSFQWPQYPTAAGATRLVNQGVVVVTSIGNSGANGLYSSSAPGVGEKVIGTASFDNTHVTLPVFTISPDDKAIGYSNATAAAPTPTSGSFPMARTGTATSAADACNGATAPAPGSLTGKVALIRRGTCGFHEKALNAQNAGAAGVVLYNNAAGFINPTVAGTPAITIPVVATTAAEGVLINNRLAAGAVTMTWTDDFGSFVNATGGLISGFSSYGMSPDLALKPDIGAPGGQIFSTIPLELGAYGPNSGTSMASPHVAGTVALLLQAAPNTSVQSVRSILQNSASPKVWGGNPALGFLDNVHRQGAGMVQIDKAILATTRVNPGKLSLGESAGGPSTQTLTITNTGSGTVTYALSSVNALSTGANTFTPSFSTSNAAVSFSAPSVTVGPGASASFTATITGPTGPANGVYGGYLVATPDNGSSAVRVPFAGYIGDYQARQVLVPTASGFPWLARRVSATSYSNRPAGETYTMVDALNIPYFAVHLDHQSRRVRFELVDAVSGKSWHRISEDEYVGRNSTATGFFAFAFDGTTTAGSKTYTVPNGQYVAKLSVLKALGDAANPAHWETWTSPVITIARP